MSADMKVDNSSDIGDPLMEYAEVHPEVDSSRRNFLISLGVWSVSAILGLTPEAASAGYASALEKKIEHYIKGLRQQGVIPWDEKTAWSVYDFTTKKKLVSINEDIPYQSASMIKPFIALAFFYKADEGDSKCRYSPRKKQKMEAMIRKSSNSATNYFIDLLTYRNGRRRPREVEHILKKHAPGIFRDTRIVEKIPKNGRTYRNKASAHDYSRFLYALWGDRFPYSHELKRLMSLPNGDRICRGVGEIPGVTEVYDKTGTTARLCGNMGILVAKGKNGRDYPYTFIGIIEKSNRTPNYSGWSLSRGNVIRGVSRLVYSELKRVHNLV